MVRLRVLVTVLLIVVWGMFTPLAMATDHCFLMGGACETPCGASSCLVAAPVSAVIVEPVAVTDAFIPADAPAPLLGVLELPPKPKPVLSV
jgi:hypothetical protein